MHPIKRNSLIVLSFIVLNTIVSTKADVTEDAKTIKISGGEHFTLVLTNSKNVFGCGDNDYYQLGNGNNTDQWTLVQVLKGDMNSPTNYLEDIDDIVAGWTHSLALDDVNGCVWAWGNNTNEYLSIYISSYKSSGYNNL